MSPQSGPLQDPFTQISRAITPPPFPWEVHRKPRRTLPAFRGPSFDEHAFGVQQPPRARIVELYYDLRLLEGDPTWPSFCIRTIEHIIHLHDDIGWRATIFPRCIRDVVSRPSDCRVEACARICAVRRYTSAIKLSGRSIERANWANGKLPYVLANLN